MKKLKKINNIKGRIPAWIILISCIIFQTITTSCGAEKEETSTEEIIEVSMVDLYYVEDNMLQVDYDAYQLKQPYSVSSSIEEIMANQMISDKMIYNGFSMDEYYNVILDIDVQTSLTKEELLLNKAAVVCSLNQINNIASVRFVLRTLDDNIIEDEVYTMDSFLFYDYVGGDSLNSERIELYVPDEDGDGLDIEEVTIGVEPDQSVVKAVVDALIDRGVFPDGTAVNMIYVKDSTCYVDFNSAFEGSNGSRIPAVTIASLVNSLTSVDGVYGVRITIDSERHEVYRQVVNIGEVLYFEGGLLN